ncbi:hypothetical protein PIROE2DRAFT_61771 [Piromyces sp. E2]|nr:hypothetical protein PIROE2DRAFT_61771 [Piromyces sp. E2]|eukprot:OUM62619.1 hypothetical protein PIROE2DRAFT_61771 [Piromyces sp. E2]
MNSLKVCEYGNTNLCFLSTEKCKSTLKECTQAQIDDTDNQLVIQSNKEKMDEEKLEEEEKKESKDKNDIYSWLYRPYIFIAIVTAFVILILLLIYVVKKYIKYRYEKELKMTMGQRQYFINHSLRRQQFHNDDHLDGDISNKANSDFNNEDDSGNRYHNNNTLSSGTRNSYRPIYQDNVTTISQQESILNNGQVGVQGIPPPVFQVPALTYASPQHRSTVTSQIINNGDYLVIDQGSLYESVTSKHNSIHSLHLNNGQLHNTRSRPRTRPRSHTSGHSPVINTLTPFNTNRYSYSGMLYTSSNTSNRHSIGIYSNVNSILTNHSGNASNYGISESGTHDEDYTNENEITYSDGKSLNQNLRNNSRDSTIPDNLRNNSRDSTIPDSNNKQFDRNKNVSSKKENKGTTTTTTTTTRNPNLDVSNSNKKNNEENDGGSSSPSCSFVAKLDSSDESELEMPSRQDSQKVDDSGVDGDNDSNGEESEEDVTENKENQDANQKDDNDISHSISMITNNGHSTETIPSSEENMPEIIRSPTATSAPSTPTAMASSQSVPLSKAEIAKRESTYIKNHKRKIPVYLDKSRSIRVNSVVNRNPSGRNPNNQHRRRHSYQYSQRPLSYSNKNSYSMNNLVQLNNPNVIPIQNAYMNPSLASSDQYSYDATSSNNIQSRNSFIYRGDTVPSYSVDRMASKRAKHQSIVSIGSNGHPTYFIADDNNNTPMYSNSVHLSNALNPLYITPMVSNTNTNQPQPPSVPQGTHLEVQNSHDQESNINRTDSNTNISNLLRLAASDTNAPPTPPPSLSGKVKGDSNPNPNLNLNGDNNSGVGVERMNIYSTNVNVSGVPLKAFNINGVTYVPAGSAAAVNAQPMNNGPPSSIVMNRNSTIISSNVVPMVNTGVTYINNMNKSPNSPANSIHSPILGNPSSPHYSYGRALSSPGVSPTNSPLLQPIGFGSPPNIVSHSTPVSPRLLSHTQSIDLNGKGEIIHIEGQGQGQGQDSSNSNDNQNVPDIVLKSATNETSELSNSGLVLNGNPSYAEPVGGGHQDPIFYDEVIEVPGTDRRILRRSIYLDNDDEMYNQMIAYDGILSDSAAVADGNAQYVTYNYASDDVARPTGEVEFYYEEDTEDEAPPPYTDTFQ